MTGSAASREERVLRERAERYRRRPDADRAEPGVEHLVFRNGATVYAVEASAVAEVRRPEAFLPLPGSAGIVKGVFPRRGEMVAILDLPRFLGAAPGAADAAGPACILVLEAGGLRLGIEAQDLARTRIAPADVKPLSGGPLRHVAGLAPGGEAVLPPGPVLLRKALEEASGEPANPGTPIPIPKG